MDIKKILLQWSRHFLTKIFWKRNESQSNCAAPPNEQSADELHRTIVWKVKKREVYSSFMGKILSTGLLDMQLKSKYSKVIRFLSKVFDV